MYVNDFNCTMLKKEIAVAHAGREKLEETGGGTCDKEWRRTTPRRAPCGQEKDSSSAEGAPVARQRRGVGRGTDAA